MNINMSQWKFGSFTDQIFSRMLIYIYSASNYDDDDADDDTE